MAKSLNGSYKGKTPKRKVNKARLAAVIAGLSLAGKISITAIKDVFNNFNDPKEAIVYLDKIDRQMNEQEREQLREIIGDENYSKIDGLLKCSSDILRNDQIDEETKKFLEDNLNSFHDIYLETLKMKIAELVGMENPNEIRNIRILRNVIKDGEAPRYIYVAEGLKIQDEEKKEKLEKSTTMNLFTERSSLELKDEQIKDHVENIISVSELEGKENKSTSDYKNVALKINSFGTMLNDELIVSEKGDVKYKEEEDNQHKIEQDTDNSIELADAGSDNIDM